MLLISTVLYLAILRIYNIDSINMVMAPLLVMGALKGLLTLELADVFNIKSFKKILRKIGKRQALIELITVSLLVYYPMYAFPGGEYSSNYILLTITMFIFYRFLILGINYEINKYRKK